MKPYTQNPKLHPVIAPTNLDVAWAAGIYEGEGSCLANSRNGSFTIAIAQKDPELLYRMRDLFGGAIQFYDSVGEDGRFEVYRWNVGGNLGRIFVAAIYPYLTVRRKAQIDKTSASSFMKDGMPPVRDVAVPSEAAAVISKWAKTRLSEHVAGVAQRDKNRGERWYRKNADNEEWREKRRQATRDWRAKNKKSVSSKVINIAASY